MGKRNARGAYPSLSRQLHHAMLSLQPLFFIFVYSPNPPPVRAARALLTCFALGTAALRAKFEPSITQVLKPTSSQGTLGAQRKAKKCWKIRPRAETNCSISHEQSSLGAVCFSAFHLWEGKVNSTRRRARGAKSQDRAGKAVSEAGMLPPQH